MQRRFAAAAMLMAATGFAPAAGQEGAGHGSISPGATDAVRAVRGYRKWARANDKPVCMQPAAAAQCAAPWPQQQPSPHLQKYVTVYVNTVGRKAMLELKNPVFPAGSVIVKEKLTKADSKKPELMTIMVKRDPESNPGGGDWEYAVLDGAGAKVTSQGKLELCQSCHANSPANQNDHVFRNYYLSESRLTALK